MTGDKAIRWSTIGAEIGVRVRYGEGAEVDKAAETFARERCLYGVSR